MSKRNQRKPRKMMIPGWRREAVAKLMTETIPTLELSGRGLVIDDETRTVETAVTVSGAELVPWRRMVVDGREARAWPEDGPYDFAMLRLPTAREAFQMMLHAIAARLKPGGRLFVCGANDEGIRPAGNHIKPIFGDVENVRSKWHCRLLCATLDETPAQLKADLADWRIECSGELPDGEMKWISYPGAFAHGKIDQGTLLLLDALPEIKPEAKVLDFGCGVGIMSAAIRRKFPETEIEMLDIDAIALEAAKENVPNARAVLSDNWRAIGSTKYDLIMSNPPIHSGKGKDFRVVKELIRGAATHLRYSGELWIVTQRTVPVREQISEIFRHVTLVLDENFRIWRAKGAKK